MIRVESISKNFRVHRKEPGLKGSLKSLFRREWVDKLALNQVSLNVEGGEILGLIGANGAGKTTLVKILAGIIHPTSGRADVMGYVPWERKNEFRRQIALIMGQKAQLWWDLPASDCFLLLKEIYQIPQGEFQERLDYLTDALSVRGELNIQIRRLSLGERMKMELIAALLHQPRVVFLDEPTIGLDLTAQRVIRNFLLEYRRAHQPAMIVTSHYMEDIESLCERIVIIREGEFIYDGPLQKVVTDHTQFKVVEVRVTQGSTLPVYLEIPESLGSVIEINEETIRIRAAREKVAELASILLHKLDVADLDIEEEDIGTIIESIMRKESI
jgi:ABC-2 type transport system ATP-binding protein